MGAHNIEIGGSDWTLSLKVPLITISLSFCVVFQTIFLTFINNQYTGKVVTILVLT